MPVGLYVNNSIIDTNDPNIKNVLSQLYTSSSSSSTSSSSSSSSASSTSLSSANSLSSSSSSSSSSSDRLDSRSVVFVVLTQNDLNNLQNTKLNEVNLLNQLNDLQFPSTISPIEQLNKENTLLEQITNDTTSSNNNNNNSNIVSLSSSSSSSNNMSSSSRSQIINDDELKLLLGDSNFNFNLDLNQTKNISPNQNSYPYPLNNGTCKNNIDFAIDAVLAKCREENHDEQDFNEDHADDYDNNNESQEQPVNQNTIPQQINVNNNNEMNKNPKKLCKKPVINMINNKIELSSTEAAAAAHNTSCSSSSSSESNQSKSTKARTSYISSLIANREKSADIQDTKSNNNINDNKNKNIQNILSCTSKTSSSIKQSNQVSIQPKPQPIKKLSNILPNSNFSNQSQNQTNSHTQIDFVLNTKKVLPQTQNIDSNLSRLLSQPIDTMSVLDYEKLESTICESTFDKSLVQISLTKLTDFEKPQNENDIKLSNVKNKPVKKSIKTKRKIEDNLMQEKTDNLSLNQQPKPKKLKTIADIVKHQNSSQQQQQQILQDENQFHNHNHHHHHHHHQPNEQQLTLKSMPLMANQETYQTMMDIQQNINDVQLLKNEDLTITWINQNHLINNIHFQNQNDHDHLNMENLLELELSTDHHQSPIDKFIDLDDIDVNPLDCYRTNGATNANQQVLVQNQNNQMQSSNNNNTNLDEFNLQFSVCSSSSSGFSEPSNFSCSSSMSSGSASNLSYTNCASNALSVNSINNCLFSPDESSPCTYQSYEHNSPNPQYTHHQSNNYSNMTNSNTNQHLVQNATNNNSNSNQNQTIDWNMIEFGEKNATSIQNGSVSVNCGESMFGNFNFFSDEIKLEI